MSQNLELDQFFTKKEIAEYCVNTFRKHIRPEYRKLIIDPSAGDGIFLDYIPKSSTIIAVDIDPKNEVIQKLDFLKQQIHDINRFDISEISIIGNPPFGKCSNLAIKFFNRSTEYGNSIGFIVPKTFKKISIQNKLNMEFDIIYEEDLPKNSFRIEDNKEYDVPCCFQIWAKRKNIKNRNKIDENENILFEYTDKMSADLALRRVGGKTGHLIDIDTSSESSTYYLTIRKGIKKETVINIINNIYPYINEMRNNTAGVRSLSKTELNILVKDYISCHGLD